MAIKIVRKVDRSDWLDWVCSSSLLRDPGQGHSPRHWHKGKLLPMLPCLPWTAVASMTVLEVVEVRTQGDPRCFICTEWALQGWVLKDLGGSGMVCNRKLQVLTY